MKNRNGNQYDVVIIGSGIVGLAHARALVKFNKSILVIDASDKPNGASVRNFGFVTITGQEIGQTRDMAVRSSVIWREIAQEANIPIHQNGVHIIAQRTSSAALLEEYFHHNPEVGCKLLSRSELISHYPNSSFGNVELALEGSLDLRINPRLAIPQLRRWLHEKHGVEFLDDQTISHVESGRVLVGNGVVECDQIFVCTGDNLSQMFGDQIRGLGVTRCKLQMMRLESNGTRFPSPIMSDLSLIRYGGFASMPSAQKLKDDLFSELPEFLENGIHIIIVQDLDGSLVVGDSHEYGLTFNSECSPKISNLIGRGFQSILPGYPIRISEQWFGSYATSKSDGWIFKPLESNIHLCLLTNGLGMSTSFGVAEQNVSQVYKSNIA